MSTNTITYTPDGEAYRFQINGLTYKIDSVYVTSNDGQQQRVQPKENDLHELATAIDAFFRQYANNQLNSLPNNITINFKSNDQNSWFSSNHTVIHIDNISFKNSDDKVTEIALSSDSPDQQELLQRISVAAGFITQGCQPFVKPVDQRDHSSTETPPPKPRKKIGNLGPDILIKVRGDGNCATYALRHSLQMMSQIPRDALTDERLRAEAAAEIRSNAYFRTPDGQASCQAALTSARPPIAVGTTEDETCEAVARLVTTPKAYLDEPFFKALALRYGIKIAIIMMNPDTGALYIAHLIGGTKDDRRPMASVAYGDEHYSALTSRYLEASLPGLLKKFN